MKERSTAQKVERERDVKNEEHGGRRNNFRGRIYEKGFKTRQDRKER